ncbi:28S ribosomal protein S2, mitochondrial [Strongyloides ratti]|uniref:28S ribosomal protein S2, mitochondrial n=1 Tax=Strongyloides ratti TaxID=34506 RepID=A0A090KX34_STRRB|nr:28S ribosomal protein S2, mitochondrial [Strongyloides ratti]CEF62065.1 28S ribosomal protein S2, mitochondrial [Strongyloides ratti]
MIYSPLKRLTFFPSKFINRVQFLSCSIPNRCNLESEEIENIPTNEILTKATTRPRDLLPYIDTKLHEDDFFKMSELVTINELFRRKVHFGHKIGTLSENMKWALYGERLGSFKFFSTCCLSWWNGIICLI